MEKSKAKGNTEPSKADIERFKALKRDSWDENLAFPTGMKKLAVEFFKPE
jgi:hypothetical protein